MRFWLFFLFPFLVLGQDLIEKEEKLFVALYIVGDAWDAQKLPNEQQYFEEHSAFLKQLRSDEDITIGARFGDTGMIVFKAIDATTAEALVNSDLAVKNHLFDVTVHPFAPFYKGCIE